jgi:hypothetical protein
MSFMKHLLLVFTAVFFLAAGVLAANSYFVNFKQVSGAPPYDASGTDNVSLSEEQQLIQDWKRPEGPAKVALQVGHWKTDEVPEELQKLRGNTGASGGGKSESEVNYAIAELTKELLEEKGITVELLPTTVTPQYWADVFVSIHADGNPDPSKTGYKTAVPRRDRTGNADELLTSIEKSYAESTGMILDPNVTRNMRGYYAFSWWRYDHAVHPMTTSLILETGFLSSPSDRNIIVDQPELSAKGLADGITEYLISKNLLSS